MMMVLQDTQQGSRNASGCLHDLSHPKVLMTRLNVALVAAVLAGQAGQLINVPPPGGNEPGKMTVARFYILNKDKSEAVPVTVHSSGEVLPVSVTAMPAVTIAGSASVMARAARQTWEYRQITIGGDAADQLNAAGLDGWEAVGSAAASAGRTTWLLKRPR
jgi:hypothetical protein